MIQFRVFYILMIITLVTVSCASKPKVSPVLEKEIISEMEKADKMMSNYNYESALKIYNKYIDNHPGTNYDLILIYNSGIAYEELQQCEKAKDRYRKVVNYSIKEFESLKAYALFRLAYMYECLGENDKSITAFLDSRRRNANFPIEIAKAEIPARLSVAYARNGREKESLKYFDEAMEGLKLVKKQYRGYEQKANSLSKTLYLMGRMNFTETLAYSLQDYLNSLKVAQIFLLKSIEIDNKKWSNKSQDQVFNSYGYIWNSLQSLHPDKKDFSGVNQEEIRKTKFDIGIRALENLSDLKRFRFPEQKEPLIVQKFFSKISKIENKFENYVRNLGISTQLTREALKNLELKKKGKVENPNPILERK